MAREKKIKKTLTVFTFKNSIYAMEYYKRKHDLGLKTEKECHALLAQMAREGKMRQVSQTGRSPNKWVNDQKKHGFKILDMRQKKTVKESFLKKLRKLIKIFWEN